MISEIVPVKLSRGEYPEERPNVLYRPNGFRFNTQMTFTGPLTDVEGILGNTFAAFPWVVTLKTLAITASVSNIASNSYRVVNPSFLSLSLNGDSSYNIGWDSFSPYTVNPNVTNINQLVFSGSDNWKDLAQMGLTFKTVGATVGVGDTALVANDTCHVFVSMLFIRI